MSDQKRPCLVVGASGALGSAVVDRLLGADHPVIAVARNAAGWADRPGVRACAADIGDDSAIDRIAGAVSEKLALALFCPGLPVTGGATTSEAAFLARAVDVKVSGLVRLVQALGDQLTTGSRLVAVAGSLGIEPGPADAAPGVANAGLLNLMRQLSQSLGPRGVTTVTIAPGPLDTPRLHEFARRRAAESGRTPEDVMAGYRSAPSSGELPTADEVAWLITTLLAPQARILHGSVLSPDGGVRHGLV